MCGTTEQGHAIRLSSSSSENVSSDARSNGATRNLSSDAVVNLDHGDPTIFETYWRNMGDKCTVMIPGYQSLSYFADTKSLCWFLEPKLEESIKNLHNVVGNAVVDDNYIVVGTGSSQLIQAALYALSPPDQPKPASIVCAAPYYSCYKEMAEFLRSELYKWEGDAHTFDKEGPYIEMVTSPNNPDGVCREAVVKKDGGKRVHDLAYYWPQYTPITAPADYDIMLFTVSKCTGHAGSRLGWALVKDKEVAKKMVTFMTISTIGVSKESQHRAAKILEVISNGCKDLKSPNGNIIDNFFHYGQSILTKRWDKLRNTLKHSRVFSLAKYPVKYCHFTQDLSEAHPAFAWIKSKDKIDDCEKLFRGHKVLTRSGKRFGSDPKYVRVSMVSKEEDFELFIKRLSSLNNLNIISAA
ncbi:L-tryptophan--pyruvate aminotransferase 1 [Heracleum sosnowskyi]|uniref:L-tryptophan--pyruvate aminotransferase 1 n=1 Tax=Heracleum sosnowskyi TaxID=360622 RepID=A0AAD8M9K6_9APIA|nr:L-tryptophan--pyruvate aminotransferase 1 [Heracleum sosnowskyi]